MDALGAFDDVFYNSDVNGPPEATEADSFHYEKAILQEVHNDAWRAKNNNNKWWWYKEDESGLAILQVWLVDDKIKWLK